MGRGAGTYFTFGKVLLLVRIVITRPYCCRGCPGEEYSCWSKSLGRDLPSPQKRRRWGVGGGGGGGGGCILYSTLKKKFRTHVIKLDIAPMSLSYPPGQYLLVSASNNMLYYLSQ